MYILWKSATTILTVEISLHRIDCLTDDATRITNTIRITFKYAFSSNYYFVAGWK